MDNIKEEVRNLVKTSEVEVKSHSSELIRNSVEETLNTLLDEEANKLCQASKYERNKSRQDRRAGKYKRKLHTKAGEVTLEVPKLRQQVFETAIVYYYT